eukprot:m.269238 g.269238  ORF g.269238 m.269238 type:complete len:470 (-) comp83218_c0_seq1:224-1633(-)
MASHHSKQLRQVPMIVFGFFAIVCQVVSLTPPTLDDLWNNTATFMPYVSIPVGSAGFAHVDAGTRVVVMGSTWYLFGRFDSGPTANCPQGEISINVRSSTDQGMSWGAPHAVVAPDEKTTCIFADGTAFYDQTANTWHYLSQVLDVGGKGGWQLSHFSLQGTSPFGTWIANPQNPVVKNGALFSRICAGVGKHCQIGMGDEGTPQIVQQVGGDFYVTFHGYDYNRKRAVRGVARTPDFVTWDIVGGADPLSGDVIFSDLDCTHWNVSWGVGGCIGSGEASILRTESGYMYEVIEATDIALTCDTSRNSQWWPLGLVRSKSWAASPQWEQMGKTPFVGGPTGNEPHVGCSIQYNSLHLDSETNKTYFAFWDVSFYPANKTTAPQTWHMYELVWGGGDLPMIWPGPRQSPPPPPTPPPPTPNCATKTSCKATCSGFVECPSDGRYYCCAATACNGTHLCAGTSGLKFCACP